MGRGSAVTRAEERPAGLHGVFRVSVQVCWAAVAKCHKRAVSPDVPEATSLTWLRTLSARGRFPMRAPGTRTPPRRAFQASGDACSPGLGGGLPPSSKQQRESSELPRPPCSGAVRAQPHRPDPGLPGRVGHGHLRGRGRGVGGPGGRVLSQAGGGRSPCSGCSLGPQPPTRQPGVGCVAPRPGWGESSVLVYVRGDWAPGTFHPAVSPAASPQRGHRADPESVHT